MGHESGDPCGIARLLGMLGGRWKGPILWWLRGEARGFNELRRLLPGVSPKVLTNQLRQLEDDGLICRAFMNGTRGRICYSLTERGTAVMPLLDAMQDWSRKHLPLAKAAT